MFGMSYVSGFTPSIVIGGLRRRIEDMTPAMDAVGEALVSEAMHQFEVGGDPAWKDLAESTKRQKSKRGFSKILVNLAILKNSYSYEAEADSVQVDAAGPYARIQTFGGKAGRNLAVKIPARPAIRENAETDELVNDILDDYILEVTQ